MSEPLREYTDERFPDLIITNDGSNQMVINRMGEGGLYEPVGETMVPGVQRLTAAQAQHIAAAMFGQMFAQRQNLPGGEEGGGVATEEPEGPESGPVPKSRLARGALRPHPGVNPLAGMQPMTAADVDRQIAAARAERDPAKARALQRQALSMMAQESQRRGESRARCWVRHLLAG